MVGAQHPQPVGQGTLEVPGRAAGLALAVEEQSGLVEEVGGGLGVGVRWGVAGQGVDVREQHPPARPARRVLPVREGGGELAGGLVAGGVYRLGVTVGVARAGGAGHGLHQPVHGQDARVGGEHAVGGQAADRAQHRRRVGQPVQQGPGDRVGGVPGQDPQHLPGQRVTGQPVQGDVPDPGDGAGGVAALGGGLVHGGRVAGQQVQVLPRGGAGLGQVGAGLLDGQRQEAQLRAQPGGAVQVPRLVLGEDRGQQGLRLGRVQHIQPDRHRGAVPACRAAAGDQVPAGRGPGQQRRDIGRAGDVVQDQQPPGVGGQPLHRPFPQRLQRQHTGQRRLQRDGQGRQPGVDISRGGGGDPPGQGVVAGVGGGPARGQGALADPAQAVHRLHHHPARPGQRRIQPGQLPGPAHEQPRPRRQVRQARRGGQLRPRPERLLRQRRRLVDLLADLGERAGVAGLGVHLDPGTARKVPVWRPGRGGGHGRL